MNKYLLILNLIAFNLQAINTFNFHSNATKEIEVELKYEKPNNCIQKSVIEPNKSFKFECDDCVTGLTIKGHKDHHRTKHIKMPFKNPKCSLNIDINEHITPEQNKYLNLIFN